MADQNSNTHSNNPFLGEDNEATLVKAFTVTGMLREFVSVKTDITYDEKEALALILQGVESALIDQNTINTTPISSSEKAQTTPTTDQILALYKIASPETQEAFWAELHSTYAPEYAAKGESPAS